MSTQTPYSANSISQNNLSGPSNPSSSSSSIPSLSDSNNTGFFSNFDWRIWLLIIFVLAILGINIFLYLAKGTQTVADLSAPVAKLFGNTAIDATKQTVNVGATGAKAGIDIVAGGVTKGLDAIHQAGSDISAASSSSILKNNEKINSLFDSNASSKYNNSLNKALNDATKPNNDNPSYHADDSTSTIQSSKTAGKSGWCYIGEDRGFRSCIKVGENDQCMSGDIFPSQEICVNPNLRA